SPRPTPVAARRRCSCPIFPHAGGAAPRACPAARPGRRARSAIISPFHEAGKAINTMEAERLNAIESSLSDLRRRAGELRGYL
ncbi:hypothetical protein, partial [Burkholderia glumae]|uniref:hypothetical protein n=1 Tax=Burkholderia glumae TaxID=337 RepID=UPI0019D6DEB8